MNGSLCWCLQKYYLFFFEKKKPCCFGVVAMSSSGKELRTLFTSTLSLISQTKDMSITDDHPTGEIINTNYLLAGGGVLTVLFLCVFGLQMYICKRSKFTKTCCKHNTCEEMEIPDESANDVQNQNTQAPRTNNRARKKPIINQPAEPAYHDIDESMELEQSPVLSNASQEYESSSQMSRNKLSYLPLSLRDYFLIKQRIGSQVEPNGERDENKPDLYLQPISIEEKDDDVAKCE